MKIVNLSDFLKCDDASPFHYKHLWRNEALVITKHKVYLFSLTEKYQRILSSEQVEICEHHHGGNVCDKCTEFPLI